MSWSLQLQHGDFVVSGAQITPVTGSQKLVQDLRCALLEQMGNDDMHLNFGSLIDGGRLPDGTVVPGLITDSVQAATSGIESEIERIAAAYQNQQLERAKNDRLVYNRVSLAPTEVLIAITNIQMVQNQDTVNVVVTLQTATGQDLSFALPAQGPSPLLAPNS